MNGFIAAGLALLGWITGYCVNYLADVLPQTRTFSQPTCPACGASQQWSFYLRLQGCPTCGKQRPIRTWLVQFGAILVTFGLWLLPEQHLGFGAGLVLMTYFGVVAVIDIEHRLILHPVSLFGIVLGAALGLWRHGWWSTLSGGAAGFSIMLALYWFGGVFAQWIARLRGEELDEVALGFGDVNLSGILGLILGWPGIAAGLMGAILLGGLGSLMVLGYMLVSRRYQAFVAIPYAPFLILSAVALLFYPR